MDLANPAVETMEQFRPNPNVARIRERLAHPVIDSDGHLVELRPVAMEYIVKAGGADMRRRFVEEQRSTFLSRDWYGLSQAERMSRWTRRPPFWGEPLRNGGLDLATATFPDLLYNRLDQLGIDFAVLYPTIGIGPQGYADDETRRACCRGLNDYYADHWMGHPDRMTPVAIIPMFSPEEAIEELDYAVTRRGFKAVMLPSYVKRPISGIVDDAPDAARFAWRADTFGIDSPHDYDPVWAKCRELGVVPSFHSPGEGSTFHDSISNPVYNHVGHFATAATAICKSLFLGGVSQRFPELRFLSLRAASAGHAHCSPTSQVTGRSAASLDSPPTATPGSPMSSCSSVSISNMVDRCGVLSRAMSWLSAGRSTLRIQPTASRPWTFPQRKSCAGSSSNASTSAARAMTR